MSVFIQQKGAALSVSRGVAEHPLVHGQGGPDEPYTQSGGAAHPRIHPRVHTTDLSTLRHLVVGRHPDHGTADDQQPAVNGAESGSGTSLELSPRLVPATWVELEIGPCAGGVHPASLGSRRPGESVRGRHGRRTSGKEGLRSAVGGSSRCRSLDAFVPRVPLGAQMGGAGHPGEVPVRQATVGLARSGGPVSFPGMERATRAPTPNSLGTHAAVAGRVDSLVRRRRIRLRRGRRLREPSRTTTSSPPTWG